MVWMTGHFFPSSEKRSFYNSIFVCVWEREGQAYAHIYIHKNKYTHTHTHIYKREQKLKGRSFPFFKEMAVINPTCLHTNLSRHSHEVKGESYLWIHLGKTDIISDLQPSPTNTLLAVKLHTSQLLPSQHESIYPDTAWLTFRLSFWVNAENFLDLFSWIFKKTISTYFELKWRRIITLTPQNQSSRYFCQDKKVYIRSFV